MMDVLVERHEVFQLVKLPPNLKMFLRVRTC